MSVYEKLAEKTTAIIGKYAGVLPESEKYQTCRYVIHAVYINLFKTAILAAVVLPLGMQWHVLCFIIGFALIRAFSFGAHLPESWKCTLAGLAMYIGGSYLSSVIVLPLWVQVLIFTFCAAVNYRYAPVGTDARPVFDRERKRLKILSLSALAIVAVCAGAFPYVLPAWTGTALTLAALCQSISILPVTQRVMAGIQKSGESGTPDESPLDNSTAMQRGISLAPPMETPKQRFKPWQVRTAATVLTMVVFIVPFISNLCIYPIWYEEPTMPECLRERCRGNQF